MNIIVTGGAGFIGSALIRYLVKNTNHQIANIDKLTYAGHLESLDEVSNSVRYSFEKVDICDSKEIKRIFQQYKPEAIMHLAAESHVDRSIDGSADFIRTNIVGTHTLLEEAKEYWKSLEEKSKEKFRFLHISTDEVYGALGDTGFFTEDTPYDPRSPYSSSKASSDHLVRAWYHTYGLPTMITNCSNNYGPNQFPEKLIPLFINNILNNKPLPVYGKGENVRDWLYVVDHARAIDTIFHKGAIGETYNIGGFNEWKNIDLIKVICRAMDKKLGRPEGTSEKLITYVTDRAGHDHRYAIDATKIKNELGWKPSLQFEGGIELTIDWYFNNSGWLKNIETGDYVKN